MKPWYCALVVVPLLIEGCTAIAGISGFDEVPCSSCSDASGGDGSGTDTNGIDTNGVDASGTDTNGIDASGTDSTRPDVTPFDAGCTSTTDTGPCPCGMAEIPAGSFTGSDRAGPVDKFCLDVIEVTEAAFRPWCESIGLSKCVPADIKYCGGGIPTNYGVAARANDPINCVDWYEASDYCAALGKRLPTEVEWEFAERGAPKSGDGRLFPWGNGPPDDTLTCWKRSNTDGSCPVGTHAAGISLQGIHDLAGNVEEWTSTGFGTTDYVRRGGGWYMTDPNGFNATYGRGPALSTERDKGRGFRCAK